jgi:transcriptional regulator with XRE-family HTH domain
LLFADVVQRWRHGGRSRLLARNLGKAHFQERFGEVIGQCFQLSFRRLQHRLAVRVHELHNHFHPQPPLSYLHAYGGTGTLRRRAPRKKQNAWSSAGRGRPIESSAEIQRPRHDTGTGAASDTLSRLVAVNPGAQRVKRVAELVDSAMRQRPDLTLNQIALKAGVDTGYLSRIRHAKIANPPSPDILRQLAKALQIPYKSLLEAAGYWDESLEAQVQDPQTRMFFRARRVLDPDEIAEIMAIIEMKLKRFDRRQGGTKDPSS